MADLMTPLNADGTFPRMESVFMAETPPHRELQGAFQQAFNDVEDTNGGGFSFDSPDQHQGHQIREASIQEINQPPTYTIAPITNSHLSDSSSNHQHDKPILPSLIPTGVDVGAANSHESAAHDLAAAGEDRKEQEARESKAKEKMGHQDTKPSISDTTQNNPTPPSDPQPPNLQSPTRTSARNLMDHHQSQLKTRTHPSQLLHDLHASQTRIQDLLIDRHVSRIRAEQADDARRRAEEERDEVESYAQEMEGQLEEVGVDNQALRARLAGIVKERERMTGRLGEIGRENEGLRRQLAESGEKLKQSMEAAELLQGEVGEVDSFAQEMGKQMEEVVSENQALQDQLSAAESNLRRVESSMETTINQRLEAKRRRMTAEGAQRDAERTREFQDLERELREEVAWKRRSTAAGNESKRELKAIGEQLATTKNALEDAHRAGFAHEEELALFKKALQGAHRTAMTHQGEMTTTKNALEVARLIATEQEEEVATTKNALEASRRTATSCEGELGTTKTALEEARRTALAHEEELATTRAALEEARREAMSYEEEKRAVAQERDTAVTESQQAQRDLDAAQKTITHLCSALVEKQASVESLIAKWNSDHQKELHETDAQVDATARDEIKHLKTRLEAEEERNATLVATANEWHRQLKVIGRELVSKRNELNRTWSADKIELESKLAALEEKEATLEPAAGKLREELKQLQDQLAAEIEAKNQLEIAAQLATVAKDLAEEAAMDAGMQATLGKVLVDALKAERDAALKEAEEARKVAEQANQRPATTSGDAEKPKRTLAERLNSGPVESARTETARSEEASEPETNIHLSPRKSTLEHRLSPSSSGNGSSKPLPSGQRNERKETTAPDVWYAGRPRADGPDRDEPNERYLPRPRMDPPNRKEHDAIHRSSDGSRPTGAAGGYQREASERTYGRGG